MFLPSGIISKRDLSKLETVDPTKITEYITHSWYDYKGGNESALHPFAGETQPNYTGPQPPYDRLDTNAKYSWLKSPRYDGEPMEVGPLARMLVAYVSGHAASRSSSAPCSTSLALVPRPCSRLWDASPRAASKPWSSPRNWMSGSTGSPATWRLATSAFTTTQSGIRRSWPADAMGAGFHEAPRGSLGHWVHIKDGVIANYQCVVPSTWNAGPRDGKGPRGPYEEALLATPVADAERPLEILRTVHSFDPCMACGVHVVDQRAAKIGAREGPMSDATTSEDIVVRVYVWQIPVRITHWLIACASSSCR